MSDDEDLLKAIKHYQGNLDKYFERGDNAKLLYCIQKLYKLPVRTVHLELTGVGRTVNVLRKVGGEVGDKAKQLVAKWKEMVQDEENRDNQEEEDLGNDSEESEEKENVDSSPSSHREEKPERKPSSSSKRKRKHSSDSSSSDSEPEEKPKPKEDKEKEREREKHKSNEHRHKSKKSKHKEDRSKEKSESKERHESKSERHEKKSKEKDTKHRKEETKHKKEEKTESKDRKHSDKHKKSKHEPSTSKSKHKPEKKKEEKKDVEVPSGSFAEALGMCEPLAIPGTSSKKKAKSSSSLKEKETVPSMLKEPPEPLELNISKLLPPITPNYRPLGNFPLDTQPKKILTDDEALSRIISSKTQRTKVYSGNKSAYSKVPSLFELCIRVLQDNIDAFEYTGGVPYTILKPILERASPDQLYVLEQHNPYLIDDSGELWQLHCQREFRNKEREEMETWRDMYIRCVDERDAKLRALTVNLKHSQEAKLPVRTTKLAYVDDFVKPPRNIARKQAKNGTAVMKKPIQTPSSRLNELAVSGEAGKIAVPNPGARAVERSAGASSSAMSKPKRAPLMAKTLSFIKNRFKR